MKRIYRNPTCPINFALESFGDSWSLLIIRDIISEGKKTYKEFLESKEAISTNILASRLKQLQKSGILVKKQDPTDKSKHTYELTEKGLDLIPIVMEMALWGTKHGSEMIIAPQEFMTELRTYRDKTYPKIHKAVAQGSSLYTGEHKVIKEEIET